MVVRFQKLLQRIGQIDRDLAELRRNRERIPGNRAYTEDLQLAFDRHINGLLNERIELEQLEIEDPPDELVADIVSVDLATATRIRVDRKAPEKEPTQREQKVLELLRKLPKTEVHLHMEACISRETLMDMMAANKQEVDEAKIAKLYDFKNLQESVQLFLFILDAIISPDDFVFIFRNLRQYLEANNVRYCEAFYAPSRMIQNGLNFKEIAQVLEKEARECRLAGGPDVRFLVDVSRTFGVENASKNLERILEAKTDTIIGIGLGGAELMGPARDYKDVFAQAHAEGLHAVAHAGEDDGPWSVRDAVEVLKAERLGHGISAIQDPSLVQLLKEKGTPIEICLTSNLFTGKYVREERNHPVRHYYDQGLVCCINTDDPEIFRVDLTQEYFKLYRHLDFTVSELTDLIRQGVMASFNPGRARMWKQFEKEIAALRKEHDL